MSLQFVNGRLTYEGATSGIFPEDDRLFILLVKLL